MESPVELMHKAGAFVLAVSMLVTRAPPGWRACTLSFQQHEGHTWCQPSVCQCHWQLQRAGSNGSGRWPPGRYSPPGLGTPRSPSLAVIRYRGRQHRSKFAALAGSIAQPVPVKHQEWERMTTLTGESLVCFTLQPTGAGKKIHHSFGKCFLQ